nr:immunoglobulin light chain junction region [Macaca mulatta]
CLQHNSAPLTF